MLPYWRFYPVIGKDCTPSPRRVATRVWFEIADGKARIFVTHLRREPDAPSAVMKPTLREPPRFPRAMLDAGLQADVYAMLVILPDKRDGLDDFERRLDARVLDDCVSRLRHREVEIFLPRFRITWGVTDLADPLKSLGMHLAFFG